MRKLYKLCAIVIALVMCVGVIPASAVELGELFGAEAEFVAFADVLSFTGNGVLVEVDDNMSLTVFREEADGSYAQMTYKPAPVSNPIQAAWNGVLPWSVGTGTGATNFNNASAKLLSDKSGYVTTGTRSTGNVTGNEVAYSFVTVASATEHNVVTYFGPGDRLTVVGFCSALNLYKYMDIESSYRNPGVVSVSSSYLYVGLGTLNIARFVENNFKIYDPLPAGDYIVNKREAGLWTQQGATLVHGRDYVVPMYNTMGYNNATRMDFQRCASTDLVSRNNWFWGENGGLPFNVFWGTNVGITLGFATPHLVRSVELPTRGSAIANQHDTAYQWVGWPGQTLVSGTRTKAEVSYIGVHTGDNYTGSRQYTQAMSYIPNLCINGHDLPADWLAPPDPNGFPDYAWDNTVESWGGGEGFDPMRGIDMANDGTFARMGIKYVVLDAAWYPRGNGTGTHNPGGTAWYPTAEEFAADPAYAGLTLAQQQTLYRTKQAQWCGEGNYIAIPGKWVNVANYFGIPLSGPFDYEGAKKTVRAWSDYLHDMGFKTGGWCMPMSVYLHTGDDDQWSSAIPGTGAVVNGRDIRIVTSFTEAFPDYLITSNAAVYDPETGKLMPDSPAPWYRRQTGYYPQVGTAELCLGNPRVLDEYTTYFANLIFGEYGFDAIKIDTQWGTQQCFAIGHGHDGNPDASFQNYSLFWKYIYDKGKEILGEDPWVKHCQCGTMMSFFTQNGTNRPITGDPGSGAVRKARYSIKMWKGLYGDNATAVSDHISNFSRRSKGLMAAGYVMETRAWNPTDQDYGAAHQKYFNMAMDEGLNKGFFLDLYKFGFDFPEGMAYARLDKNTTYFSFFASSAPVASYTGGTAYGGGGEPTMVYEGPAELRGLVPGRMYHVFDYEGGTDFDKILQADANGIITTNVSFTECILLKAVEAPAAGVDGVSISINSAAFDVWLDAYNKIENVNAMEVQFKVTGAMALTFDNLGGAATGLGFTPLTINDAAVGGIVWEELPDGWRGKLLLGLAVGSVEFEGLIEDLIQLSFHAGGLGNATLTLESLVISSLPPGGKVSTLTVGIPGATASYTTAVHAFHPKYDLNKDGKVDLNDISIALRAITWAASSPGWDSYAVAQTNAGDPITPSMIDVSQNLAGDGVVDILDVLDILRNYT